MSQVAPTLDVQLPLDWQAVEDPNSDASLQAVGPEVDGFRSTLRVHLYAPDGSGDAPSFEDLQSAQLADIQQSFEGAGFAGDSAIDVNGAPGRVGTIVFKHGAREVIARVWTIQAEGFVVAVLALYAADRAFAERAVLDTIIDSLSVTA